MSVEGDDFVENAARAVEMSTPSDIISIATSTSIFFSKHATSSSSITIVWNVSTKVR